MPDFQAPVQAPTVEFTVPEREPVVAEFETSEREPVEFSISFHSDMMLGTVETLPPGSDAYVENVGTERNQIWNIGIPQGVKGEQGMEGPPGTTDHMELLNRDAENAHPMSSITGLTTALSGKQPTISDLDTIRSNAQSGKSASDTIANYGNIVTHNTSEFATSSQGEKADSALQPSDLSATSPIAYNNKVISVASGYQIPTTTQVGKIGTNETDIATIKSLIPGQATSSNQLADKSFVNSTVGTNTANYISNNGQPFTSLAQLQAYTGTVTNNDYAFISGTDEEGNTFYDRYKATVTTTTVSWAKEYRLNNSSFTASQWASIQSGITSGDVALIGTALQPQDNISKLTNDAGYITGISSSDVTGALGYIPYNSTNPNNYISRSGISATSPIDYNTSTGVISVSTGYQIPTTAQITTFTNKQDVLVSGTNIKTINGTSVLGSGNLEIELSELNDVRISSPANGQFLSYNGTNWTNTTLNALQNTATGNNSLTILGTASTGTNCLNIGKSSGSYGYGAVRIGNGGFANQNSTAIGYSARAGGNGSSNSIAIGYNSTAGSGQNSYCIAIGNESNCSGFGSISIGSRGAILQEEGVFQVNLLTYNSGLYESHSFKLLDYTGKIPEDRITKQTTLSSSSTDNQIPSAKCVYDLVGNIESLLATI